MSSFKMTNRLFIQLTLLISLCSLVSIPVSSQMISQSVTDTQKLIDEDAWLKLARQIFLEARSTYKYETGIILGQAKAGFISDALDTIEEVHPTSHSYHLISLLRNSPFLSKEQREELTNKAIYSARENTHKTTTHNLKSGDLLNIALYYSAQGDDNHSKELFYEAIKEAEAGLMEKGGNSYQRITKKMLHAPAEEIKPWMLGVIRDNFRKTKNSKDLAYTCMDMAEVAWNVNDIDQTTMYIECASLAINNIKGSKVKKRAIEKLERTKDKLHYFSTSETRSNSTLAIREARVGHIEKSYELISKLGSNLYVDHRLSAYKRVFNDAIKRNDLKGANYFAKRPVSDLSYISISTWTTLAEKQFETEAKKSALVSYKKAYTVLDKINTSPKVHLFDIKSILQLSDSMLRNNVKEQGRKSLLLAKQLLGKIPKKRVDDQVKASILVSNALWQNQMKKEAKVLFKSSYEYTKLYDTGKLHGKMKKARLLNAIGQLAVTFGTNK